MAPHRTPRFRHRFAAAVLVIAAIASACTDEADGVSLLGEGEPGLSIDDVQPGNDGGTDVDIAFATLDGGEANLTDFSGRPLVLNFFAAWCASCVSEMPDFEEVHQARGDEVTFLGMSEDLLASDSLDLIAETGITYDTGWDPKGRVLNNFRAFVMPTTVFITADGEVAHTFSGALTAATLDGLIDEHLA